MQGLHLADASVWMACAMILAVFDIQKPKGVEVAPTFTSGTIRCASSCVQPVLSTSRLIISRPSFKFTITPRSAKARELIIASE